MAIYFGGIPYIQLSVGTSIYSLQKMSACSPNFSRSARSPDSFGTLFASPSVRLGACCSRLGKWWSVAARSGIPYRTWPSLSTHATVKYLYHALMGHRTFVSLVWRTLAVYINICREVFGGAWKEPKMNNYQGCLHSTHRTRTGALSQTPFCAW